LELIKTVNSLSGGKSSSYIAKEFPADYNVFALVRSSDKSIMYPDKKVRQIVSDKIGTEFIATLEMDQIITIMLDLEQYIGKEIIWVTGITFDELIIQKKNYLPNMFARFCTTELKMIPIFEWWRSTIGEVVFMNIGYRHGEERRKLKMEKRLNHNGIEEFKTIVGTRGGGQNKWGDIPWRKPLFPLIGDRIKKDHIESYWKDKPVAFTKGYYNNCVGCFWKNPLLLSIMNKENSHKMKWFENKEIETGNRWRKEISYTQINSWHPYTELSFDDFNECDSGYCGL
jgi:hypothetical protein